MMGNVNIDEILRENVRRNRSRVVDYDPIRGVGCLGVRREVDSPDSHLRNWCLRPCSTTAATLPRRAMPWDG